MQIECMLPIAPASVSIPICRSKLLLNVDRNRISSSQDDSRAGDGPPCPCHFDRATRCIRSVHIRFNDVFSVGQLPLDHAFAAVVAERVAWTALTLWPHADIHSAVFFRVCDWDLNGIIGLSD